MVSPSIAMASFPPEIYNEIFSHFHGQKDKATLRNATEVSMPLALPARERTLTHIVFHDQSHILKFFALTSAPHTTIPRLLRCDSVVFKNTETIDEASLLAICTLLGGLQVKRTLGIHVSVGGVTPAATAISSLWGSSLRQLSICGGTHSPVPFFQFLASFPRLESLALRNVKFDAVAVAGPHYNFPPSMTQLTLSHCATLWTFFKFQVMPGGGLNSVRDLYIQELFFGGEAGVGDMRECFRQLPAVNTITLDPVHQDRRPNFNCGPRDILRKCWEATLLQMQGLTLVRLNCANIPPKFAAEYVCMYAVQFARLLVETVVEVHVPHSVDLSLPGACEELLGAANDFNVSAAGSGKRNLIIRGLPGRLPELAANPTQSVMVCEYPVTFMVTDWEEAVGARLDGL